MGIETGEDEKQNKTKIMDSIISWYNKRSSTKLMEKIKDPDPTVKLDRQHLPAWRLLIMMMKAIYSKLECSYTVNCGTKMSLAALLGMRRPHAAR